MIGEIGGAPGRAVRRVLCESGGKGWDGGGYTAVVLAGLPGGFNARKAYCNKTNVADVQTILQNANSTEADSCIMNLKDINDTELEIAWASLEGTLLALLSLWLRWICGSCKNLTARNFRRYGINLTMKKIQNMYQSTKNI